MEEDSRKKRRRVMKDASEAGGDPRVIEDSRETKADPPDSIVSIDVGFGFSSPKIIFRLEDQPVSKQDIFRELGAGAPYTGIFRRGVSLD